MSTDEWYLDRQREWMEALASDEFKNMLKISLEAVSTGRISQRFECGKCGAVETRFGEFTNPGPMVELIKLWHDRLMGTPHKREPPKVGSSVSEADLDSLSDAELEALTKGA